jgi:DNA-binding MarR family transcriptional regulator
VSTAGVGNGYFVAMPKPVEKSTLYRLIEAGQLARMQLLVPLHDRGLEQGDDAVIFAIDDPAGVSEQHLCEVTGLPPIALEMRIIRLNAIGILDRCTIGDSQMPGARLTDDGIRFAEKLEANWRQMDEALLGELDHDRRKLVKKIIKRFVKLLDF